MIQVLHYICLQFRSKGIATQPYCFAIQRKTSEETAKGDLSGFPERLKLKSGEGRKQGRLIIISLVVLFGFKIMYIYYFGKRIQFN